MNRRGHLSSKIPNVKLRPAPASRRTVRDSSPRDADDDALLDHVWRDAEDAEASTSALRSDSKPWRSVVITFTGVEEKAQLIPLALQLGAKVESALTNSVTHVVATGFGSPKYAYAVEHRIPVMTPEWIQQAHDDWIKGIDLDSEADLSPWKLKPFVGLKIAISGIEPGQLLAWASLVERRKQIVQYINNNGGVYSKDLDRSCTHLVSNKPTNSKQSSEKVKWAVKEVNERDAQRRAGKKVDGEDMKIVYEEWLWDCIGYEGRWREDGYDARKTRRTGKVSAEDVLSGKCFEKTVKAEAEHQEKEDDEPAVVRKRKRDDGIESLVGDLISTAAAVSSRPTGLVLEDEHKPAPPTSRSDQRATAVEAERKPSMLHMSRTTSFAAGPSKPSSAPPKDASPSPLPTSDPVLSAPAPLAVDATPQIFAGLTFTPIIAEDHKSLIMALKAHGGQVVPDAERTDDVDYVIVRLGSSIRPELPPGARTRIVTECWVEGCCYEQRLLSAFHHLAFQPLPASMPVLGASQLRIHLSGHSSENVVYLRRLIRAVGATLSEKLNKQTTHLLCAAPEGKKYIKALEWGVSPVKPSWLLSMAETGASSVDTEHRHVPIDEAIFAQKRLGATSGTSQPSTISPSRMLKLTPTHIGDEELDLNAAAGSALDQKALSPPKQDLERRLNQADPPTGVGKGIDAKLARVSGGSVPSTSSEGSKSNVTEALRAMAAGHGPATAMKNKSIRRPSRPSSRLRGSGTFSPAPFNASTSTTASPSKSPANPVVAARSPPVSPQKVTLEMDVEESIRVDYVDPRAERERSKLLAAFGADQRSPAKRPKVGR